MVGTNWTTRAKKEWAAGEKSWTETSRSFGSNIKNFTDYRRQNRTERGDNPDDDSIQSWLKRKVGANIELAKHRRAMAEEIERGERQGPRTGITRSVTEGVARGLTNTTASFLKGLGDAQTFLENLQTTGPTVSPIPGVGVILSRCQVPGYDDVDQSNVLAVHL